MFHDKISAVTGVSVNSQLDVVTEFCPNVDFTNRFSSYCVKQAIKSLSTGVGYDGIHSNHLKFSSPAMIFIYAKLFNSCNIHNHVPSAMLAAVINPLIKNRSANIRDSDNYREVMISSNFFKLFNILSTSFYPICSAQFGYRSGASTVLATALLKETIGGSIAGGSSVYSCFLDMSKAFERVNHDLLLSKLANKGLPTHFVRIFKSVYAQTTVKVRVNESFSDSWRICRGVRQGDITSAFLFNIYIE